MQLPKINCMMVFGSDTDDLFLDVWSIDHHDASLLVQGKDNKGDTMLCFP